MKQKTGRYLLSLLFALAMVTGLLPGTSVTAWANDGLVLGETDYSVKMNPSPYTCLGDGGSDTPDASKCVSASVPLSRVSASVPLVKSAPLSRVPLIHGCVIVALE
jgi:hypothetical protein